MNEISTYDHKQGVVTQESQINGFNKSQDESFNGEHSGPRDITSILGMQEELKIHQHLDAIEVCLGWERNNRYSIYNKDGTQILYMYEAAQCYNRQCYGSLRELTLHLTDNDDNRLLKLERPLRCSSRMCYSCCCLQELTIKTPPEQIQGVVKERWSCVKPMYELEDQHGNIKFLLTGDSCHCRLCCTIDFTVRAPNGEDVAYIHKEWAGCKEIIGTSNNFTITYLDGLSGDEKANIFGAVFLLDFNYFERHGKCF